MSEVLLILTTTEVDKPKYLILCHKCELVVDAKAVAAAGDGSDDIALAGDGSDGANKNNKNTVNKEKFKTKICSIYCKLVSCYVSATVENFAKIKFPPFFLIKKIEAPLPSLISLSEPSLCNCCAKTDEASPGITTDLM